MKQKKKRAGFFLKVVVATLAVYAAVTLVLLQIQINEQTARHRELLLQRDEQQQTNVALRSFTESELDNEAIAQIARDQLGLVLPDERLIVDVGH